MHFRTSNLHLRYTYTPPPVEMPLTELATLVESMDAPEEEIAAPVSAGLIAQFPKTVKEYPPEIPPEVPPEVLPAIAKLTPAEIKWIRNPQVPVTKTVPAPVKALAARTRRFFKLPSNCLTKQGWGVVCWIRWGLPILAIHKALVKPPRKRPAPIKPPTRTMPRYAWRGGRWNPIRQPKAKPVAVHSAPAGQFIGCNYSDYAISIFDSGACAFASDKFIKVYLNGTLIMDTGTVPDVNWWVNLATDAGLLPPFPPVQTTQGTFPRSLILPTGNIVRFEVDNATVICPAPVFTVGIQVRGYTKTGTPPFSPPTKIFPETSEWGVTWEGLIKPYTLTSPSFGC